MKTVTFIIRAFFIYCFVLFVIFGTLVFFLGEELEKLDSHSKPIIIGLLLFSLILTIAYMNSILRHFPLFRFLGVCFFFGTIFLMMILLLFKVEDEPEDWPLWIYIISYGLGLGLTYLFFNHRLPKFFFRPFKENSSFQRGIVARTKLILGKDSIPYNHIKKIQSHESHLEIRLNKSKVSHWTHSSNILLELESNVNRQQILEQIQNRIIVLERKSKWINNWLLLVVVKSSFLVVCIIFLSDWGRLGTSDKMYETVLASMGYTFLMVDIFYTLLIPMVGKRWLCFPLFWWGETQWGDEDSVTNHFLVQTVCNIMFQIVVSLLLAIPLVGKEIFLPFAFPLIILETLYMLKNR